MVGVGKGGFCAGELLPLVENQHPKAIQHGRKQCRFLDDSAWGTVWNLETLSHTHTHSQAWPCKHRKRSCSLGFTPANLACWAEIFRSEKCLPSQSLIIIAWCSLISLAISKSLYSTDLGVLERQRHLKLRNRTDSLFTCLLLLCRVLWLSPGQN